MSLTNEQKLLLGQSADFQKIIQTDPVLDELERSRFNMNDERSALFDFVETLSYRLGKKKIYPITPYSWAALWASENRLISENECSTVDIDSFFYVQSFKNYIPRQGSVEILRAQARGFVELSGVSYDDAHNLAERVIADSFRPLLQLPTSSGDPGVLTFGADWLAAVVSIVHSETGEKTDQILKMPMSKVTTFFVTHAKKHDTKHEIFKLTDADVAKKIIERTEQLANEFLKHGE